MLLDKFVEVISEAQNKVEEIKRKIPKVYPMRRGQIPYTGCAMNRRSESN